MISNPEELVLTLDRYLDHEVSLVVFGRSALCLGFTDSTPEFGETQDIDGIIPETQLFELTEDLKFWDAIEKTNEELSSKGLYITHLFGEEQVFLRENWTDHLVPITEPKTKFLKLFRPAAIDLVLTKMMRGNDTQDMEDAEFLIDRGNITPADLEAAFAIARLTDVPELHDAFALAKPVVLEIAKRLEVC